MASELQTVQELLRELEEEVERRPGEPHEEGPGSENVPLNLAHLQAGLQTPKVHTAVGRRKALLGAAQAGSATKGGVKLLAANGLGQQKVARKLAALLQTAAVSYVGQPPHFLPGAEVLCVEDQEGEREALTFAPRLALHKALRKPGDYLTGNRSGGYNVLAANMGDACIAYALFLDYPESFTVGQWFTDFAAVYGHAHPKDGDPSEAGGSKRPRKRASKKVLQEPDARQRTLPDVYRQRANSKGTAEAEAASPNAKKDRTSRSQKQKEMPAEPELKPVRPMSPLAPLTEVAARFSRAAMELQLLGLFRQSRRQRNGMLHKLAFAGGIAE